MTNSVRKQTLNNDDKEIFYERLYHGKTCHNNLNHGKNQDNKDKNDKEDTNNKENSETHTLVTELPENSLRWIKRRRNPNSKSRVPVSHFRERQLREMFDGLDYQKRGFIDLQALTDVITYIENHSKVDPNIRRSSYLQDTLSYREIQKEFDNMDENGDGVVDFQEFTHAMTGTTKSALDKASEYEIENLLTKFVECSILKKREYTIENISALKQKSLEKHRSFRKMDFHMSLDQPSNDKASTSNDSKMIMMMTKRGRILSPTSKSHGLLLKSPNTNTTSDSSDEIVMEDTSACKYYRMLFGIDEKMEYEEAVAKTKQLEEILEHKNDITDLKLYKKDKLLEELVDQIINMKQANGTLSESDLAYQEIHQRAKLEREEYLHRLKIDPKMRSLQERIEEEERIMDHSKREEAKWSTAYSRRSSISKPSTILPGLDDSVRHSIDIHHFVSKEVANVFYSRPVSRQWNSYDDNSNTNTNITNIRFASRPQSRYHRQKSNSSSNFNSNVNSNSNSAFVANLSSQLQDVSMTTNQIGERPKSMRTSPISIMRNQQSLSLLDTSSRAGRLSLPKINIKI